MNTENTLPVLLWRLPSVEASLSVSAKMNVPEFQVVPSLRSDFINRIIMGAGTPTSRYVDYMELPLLSDEEQSGEKQFEDLLGNLTRELSGKLQFPVNASHPELTLSKEVDSGLCAAEAPIQAQLISCIKAKPHESVKFFSKIGAATFLFTLLMYVVSGALIVNPIMAIFGIFGCLLFWIMAKVDEKIYHAR